jgi:hypothetical protein
MKSNPTVSDPEKVFTHRTGNTDDLQYQICRCHRCGIERRCTPSFDFFAKLEGDPLQCEACLHDEMCRKGLTPLNWDKPAREGN